MRLRIPTLFLLLLVGCQTGDSWLSPFDTEHPLVGRIWAVQDQRFISESELLALVGPVLLIGEKHDNPDHHRLRRELLRKLQDHPGLAGVAFEMLDDSRQMHIDQASAAVSGAPDMALAELKALLDWDDGWDWDFYGPLILDLMRQGVPLSAGNISREQMSDVYRDEGPQSNVLGAEQVALLKADIDASHCGMLPPDQFDAMVRVQQARDQRMAESLQLAESLQRTAESLQRTAESLQRGDAAARAVWVLVAGNYHIRNDIGVPQYLPGDSVSLAFLEVAEAVFDPEAHLREAYAPGAFDFIWFTPASSRQDYCAQLRQQD